MSPNKAKGLAGGLAREDEVSATEACEILGLPRTTLQSLRDVLRPRLVRMPSGRCRQWYSRAKLEGYLRARESVEVAKECGARAVRATQ
jgi:hypothetical protein